MDEKIKDFNFIKNFSKIKVSRICKDLKINKQNVFSNKASRETIGKVKNQIDVEIKELYKD